MELNLTPTELIALDDLCKNQELSREQILRQALRMYQAVIKGKAKYLPVFESKKKWDGPHITLNHSKTEK